MSVLHCESGGDPWATGGDSLGLMQIHYPSHAARVGYVREALYDPAVNIAVAYAIWSESGWAPWSCRP